MHDSGTEREGDEGDEEEEEEVEVEVEEGSVAPATLSLEQSYLTTRWGCSGCSTTYFERGARSMQVIITSSPSSGQIIERLVKR